MCSLTTFKHALTINQLALVVNLGWPDSEREQPQTVYLNAEMQFAKLPTAVSSDHINDTICYQTLITKLRNHLQSQSIRLLERLTMIIFEFFKHELPLDTHIQITVTKQPDIFGLTNGISFTLGDNK